MNNHLLVIVGPTAVGKTEFCIQLAEHFQAEIISADARQLYQGMHIGTAQPSIVQQQRVRHYFVDFLPIETSFSAGAFEREAGALLQDLFKRHRYVIVTGGSGLYIRALCEGLDAMPPVSASLRESLQERYRREGLSPLVEELALRDPIYCRTADLQNSRRVLRALEVCIASGGPYTAARLREAKMWPHQFELTKIGLSLERDMLYQRIDRRVHDMLEQGLLQEAISLYPYRHLQALQGIGYQELFGYLEGKHTLEEATLLIQKNTRQYAKRQLTWFKKEASVAWFKPTDLKAALAHINAKEADEYCLNYESDKK
jgi:tRNA dimethylallyltransferase